MLKNSKSTTEHQVESRSPFPLDLSSLPPEGVALQGMEGPPKDKRGQFLCLSEETQIVAYCTHCSAPAFFHLTINLGDCSLSGCLWPVFPLNLKSLKNSVLSFTVQESCFPCRGSGTPFKSWQKVMGLISPETKTQKCKHTQNFPYTFRLAMGLMKAIHSKYKRCIKYGHHPQRPYNLVGENDMDSVSSETTRQCVHDPSLCV